MYNVVNDFDEGDDLTVLKNQGTGLWIIGSSLCIPESGTPMVGSNLPPLD